MIKDIILPEAAIVGVCEKYYIRKLSLFGSVLGENFQPESDIDVLVEFVPEHIPDFFIFCRIQDELAALLEREVDLHTAESLSRHFRNKVLANTQVIYERTR